MRQTLNNTPFACISQSIKNLSIHWTNSHCLEVGQAGEEKGLMEPLPALWFNEPPRCRVCCCLEPQWCSILPSTQIRGKHGFAHSDKVSMYLKLNPPWLKFHLQWMFSDVPNFKRLIIIILHICRVLSSSQSTSHILPSSSHPYVTALEGNSVLYRRFGESQVRHMPQVSCPGRLITKQGFKIIAGHPDLYLSRLTTKMATPALSKRMCRFPAALHCLALLPQA